MVVTYLLTSHTPITVQSIGALHLTRKRFWTGNASGNNFVKFVLVTNGLEILALELKNTSCTTVTAYVSDQRQDMSYLSNELMLQMSFSDYVLYATFSVRSYVN